MNNLINEEAKLLFIKEFVQKQKPFFKNKFFTIIENRPYIN